MKRFICLLAILLPLRSLGQDRSTVVAMQRIANELRQNAKYDSAWRLLDSAITLSQILNDDSLLAKVYTEQGVICMYQGKNSDALGFFLEGLKIRELLSDSSGMAESYNFVASVHHTQTNYETASEYYDRSLQIRKRLRDEIQLGILYNNIGSLYEDQGNFGEALWNHEKSMEIWESRSDSSWLSVSLRHIGICYQKQGQLQNALNYFLQSVQFNANARNELRLVDVSNAVGALYFDLGQNDEAKEWCLKASITALQRNYLHGYQESCDCLAKVFEAQGSYDQALKYYQSSIKARDSIFGHERTKELTRLEMSFNFEKEQLADSLQFAAENALQEERIQRQRIGLLSTGMVLILILVLAVVIYRSKRRSDHLLLNILPKQVADELKENGSTRAKRLNEATVLFTDFKGFTQLSTQLSPEHLVAEIDHCFCAFDEIVGKHGIEKIKTIGDAYMAAGGVPIPANLHATDVVIAALDIQRFMSKMADEKKAKGEPYFEIRIGINSGPVVAGVVGTKKFQYDIWGDTVNTASRLESNGEVGKINISESTYQLVKDHFTCSYRGEIEVKGKGKVKMYFVEGRA